MGEVINLKRFRKRLEREHTAKKAEANRARFGRSKSARTAEDKHKQRTDELLDQHRLGGEDVS